MGRGASLLFSSDPLDGTIVNRGAPDLIFGLYGLESFLMLRDTNEYNIQVQETGAGNRLSNDQLLMFNSDNRPCDLVKI